MNVIKRPPIVISLPTVQTHEAHTPARVNKDTLGMALNAIIMQVRSVRSRYYTAVRRYEIDLQVFKSISFGERSDWVKYFPTPEEKFRISACPCNFIFIFFFFL